MRTFRLLYFPFLVVSILLFASCEKETPKVNDPLITDLIVEGHTKVGEVTITENEGYLNVKYEITDTEWLISETHLFVTEDISNIPGYPDSVNPDLFNYKMEHNPGVTIYEYTNIQNNGLSYILAQAVLSRDLGGADWDALNNMVSTEPATAYFTAGADGANRSSFEVDISGENSFIGQDQEAWCVDRDHGISLPFEGLVKFISTYDTDFENLVDGIIDIPGNIRAVNWIPNQDFVGQVHSSLGEFNYNDVKLAIWKLIEDDDPVIEPLPDMSRVTYIYNEALEHLDFEPYCGEFVGIILQPVDEYGEYNNIQPTLIPFPMPGIATEVKTVWGNGIDLGDASSAMYFTYPQ